MSITEILIAMLGAGGVGTLAGAWAKGRKAREASASAVVPSLLERMGAQDLRLDAQDGEITQLRADREQDRRDLDECHRKHAHCEETTRQQGETIAELQRMVTRSRADITERIELAAERVARKSQPAMPASRDELDTSPETPTAIARVRVREVPPPPNRRDPRAE